MDYIDNADEGYCRVVRKKVIKAFGKDICTAVQPFAYKKIPYKNKPDTLDKILLRDANPYASLAVPDKSPPNLDVEDVPDEISTNEKKKKKAVRFRERSVDDSSDSREFLAETRTLDTPSRGFNSRDINIRDTNFLNSRFDPTTTPLCIPYRHKDDFRKKYQLKLFDLQKVDYDVCVSQLNRDHVLDVVTNHSHSLGAFSLFVLDDVVYINFYYKRYNLSVKFVEFIRRFVEFAAGFHLLIALDLDEFRLSVGELMPVLTVTQLFLQYNCNAHPFRYAVIVDGSDLRKSVIKVLDKTFVPASADVNDSGVYQY